MKEGENGLRCPEGRYQCTGLGLSVCEEHILCSVELGDLKPTVALGGKSQGWSFGGPGNDIHSLVMLAGQIWAAKSDSWNPQK